jgi:hypothetical protein
MESGTPGIKSTRDGWLQPCIAIHRDQGRIAVPRGFDDAKHAARPLWKSTVGGDDKPSDFSIKAGLYTADLKGGFEGVYQQNAKDSLGEMGKETFEAVNFLKTANPAQYRPRTALNTRTRISAFTAADRTVDQSGIGLEVAFTDTGNDIRWDTHTNEGGAQGQLANFLRTFSQAIAHSPSTSASGWTMLF